MSSNDYYVNVNGKQTLYSQLPQNIKNQLDASGATQAEIERQQITTAQSYDYNKDYIVRDTSGKTVSVPGRYAEAYGVKPETKVEVKKESVSQRRARRKREAEEQFLFNVSEDGKTTKKKFSELKQTQKYNALIGVHPIELAQKGILAPSENIAFKTKKVTKVKGGRESSDVRFVYSATLEKNFKDYLLKGDVKGLNRYLAEIYEKEGQRAAIKERERLIDMGIKHTSLELKRQGGAIGAKKAIKKKEKERQKSAQLLSAGQKQLASSTVIGSTQTFDFTGKKLPEDFRTIERDGVVYVIDQSGNPASFIKVTDKGIKDYTLAGKKLSLDDPRIEKLDPLSLIGEKYITLNGKDELLDPSGETVLELGAGKFRNIGTPELFKGSLEDRGLVLTPQAEKLIGLFTTKPEQFSFIRSSTIFDPQTGGRVRDASGKVISDTRGKYETLTGQYTKGEKDTDVTGQSKISLALNTPKPPPPEIPEGYALGGSLENLMLVPTEQSKPVRTTGGESDLPHDPLSQMVYDLDMYNPIIGERGPNKPTLESDTKYVLANIGAELGSIITGGADLVSQLKNKISPLSGVTFGYQKPYVPDTVPGRGVSAPIIAAFSSSSIPEFRVRTTQGFHETYNLAIQQPWQKTLGQGIGFAGTFISPGKYLKVSPIKSTNLLALSQKATEMSLGRIITLGYGSKVIQLGGRAGEGGWFLGKMKNFERTGVSKMGGASGKSSFETYELANYNPLREKLMTPIIEFGEGKGYFVGGEFKQVFEEGRTMYKAATKLPWEKHTLKTMDIKELENIHPGIEGKSFGSNIAKTQKESLVTQGKGSLVWNLIKGGIKTKAGDFDTTGVTRAKAETAAEIVGSSKPNPGFIYNVKKTEMYSGLGKFGLDEGKTVSAISTKSGKKVLDKGINLKDTPRGLYFSTPNLKLAFDYLRKKTSPSLLEHEWHMSKILRWKDIPKADVKNLKLLALDIKSKKERFFISQERIMEYAKQKGNYLGATRPYEPKSGFYEIFAWNKSAIKSTKLIKPKTIKGTNVSIGKIVGLDYSKFPSNISKAWLKSSLVKQYYKKTLPTITKDDQKVFNIVTKSDEKIDVIGAKINKYNEFFGKKELKGSVIVDLVKKGKKIGKQITYQYVPKQIEDVLRSGSGVLGRNTAKGFRDLTPKLESALFPKSSLTTRFGFPVLNRQKDIVRKYFWAMRESARVAHIEGNRPLALEIGKHMGYQYKKFKDVFNWQEEIAKVRLEPKPSINFNVPPPTTPSSVLSSFIKESSYTSPTKGFKFPQQAEQKDTTSLKPTSFKLPSKTLSLKPSTFKSTYKPSLKPTSYKTPSFKSSSYKTPSFKSSSYKTPSLKPTSYKTPSLKPTSYKTPSFKSSSYKTPSFKSSSYKTPSLKPTSYKTPSYKTPSYKTPSYKTPSYKTPSYKTPSYKTPSYKPTSFKSTYTPPPPSFGTTTSPPVTIIPWAGILDIRKKRSKKKGKAKREDFFGSTHEGDVLGFRSKKADIAYGYKRVAKIVTSERKRERKGAPKLKRRGKTGISKGTPKKLEDNYGIKTFNKKKVRLM